MSSKIAVINRDTCLYLRDAIEENLKEFCEEFGVVIKVGSASFSSTNVTFKVEFSVVGADGQTRTKEHEDFKVYQYSHGLPLDSLGKTFVHMGEQFRLTGFLPRSRRFPFAACRVRDGKQFKMPESAVKIGLGISPYGGKPANEQKTY